MKLEDIGFYTLSDERAATASEHTPLSRCELLLTARCNFNCPYCRHVGGRDLPLEQAIAWLDCWANEGCKAIRLSGGEPTLHPHILDLVWYARERGIKRIALSTNGSASWELYSKLLSAGVNDFSVSLDVCCAEDADKLGMRGTFASVVENIKALAQHTYTTVGVVLTELNVARVNEVVAFASSLGVADIRVIPAAQDGEKLKGLQVEEGLLKKHPILAYRVRNLQEGRAVRGLSTEPRTCGLVLDDVAACGTEHFPCIIYMREGGKAIGKLGGSLRADRAEWFKQHKATEDPICSKNCLDVCIDYNRKFEARS
jgi:MoaA/NifB/PqqE/SkfB family radical SAM enzyme